MRTRNYTNALLFELPANKILQTCWSQGLAEPSWEWMMCDCHRKRWEFRVSEDTPVFLATAAAVIYFFNKRCSEIPTTTRNNRKYWWDLLDYFPPDSACCERAVEQQCCTLQRQWHVEVREIKTLLFGRRWDGWDQGAGRQRALHPLDVGGRMQRLEPAAAEEGGAKRRFMGAGGRKMWGGEEAEERGSDGAGRLAARATWRKRLWGEDDDAPRRFCFSIWASVCVCQLVGHDPLLCRLVLWSESESTWFAKFVIGKQELESRDEVVTQLYIRTNLCVCVHIHK